MAPGMQSAAMALDVETPDPPRLDRPQDPDPGEYESVDPEEDPVGDDYRRSELATLLEAGAWADAFDEWRSTTLMSVDEFRAVVDLGLIDDLDFYWNPAAGDVGYQSPAVPAERPAPYDATLDDDGIQSIEEELDSLARVVTEMIENDYLERNEDEFGFFSEED